MYIGNVMLLILNLPLVPLFAQVLRMPVYCSIRSSWAYRWWRIQRIGKPVRSAAADGVGLLGYLMRKLDYPSAPLILGLALGAGMERALRQSLMMSEASFQSSCLGRSRR